MAASFMRKWVVWVYASCGGLMLLGCGGTGDESAPSSASDATLYAKYTAKLRACGVLGEGQMRQMKQLPDEMRCDIERCFLPASCSALKAALCEWGGVENGGPDEATPVVACEFECEENTAFECANGDTVEASSVCDGRDGCQDGEASDEAGCEGKLFACGDGESVSKLAVCDGDPACKNGADERDCPSFRCKSGEQVPEALRCDGEAACADASDEAGCAPSLCGN